MALFGELGGFVAALGNNKLQDIDLSSFDHTYSKDNIVNSWNTSGVFNKTGGLLCRINKFRITGSLPLTLIPGTEIIIYGTPTSDGTYTVDHVALVGAGSILFTDVYVTVNTITIESVTGAWSLSIVGGGLGFGYTYPLINYGNVSYNYPATGTPIYSRFKDWSYKAFRPAVFVLQYIDSIIRNAGYTYSSNFLNTNYFKSLVIPNNDQLLQRRGSTKYVDNYQGDFTGFIYLDDTTYTTYIEFPTAGSLTLFTHPTTSTFTYTGINQRSVTAKVNLSGTLTKDAGNQVILQLLKVDGGVEIVIKEYNFGANQQTNLDFNVGLEGITDITPGDTFSVKFIIIPANVGGSLVVTTASCNIEYIDINILPNPQTNVPYLLGDTIAMSDTIPKNILQRDFFTSILKMFNLMVVEDRNQDKTLVIEPYIYFYNTLRSTYLDWSYKINRAKPIVIKPMSEVNARYYKLSYVADSDYYNKLYKDIYAETYGDRIFDNALEFAKDSQELKVIFSSSVLTGYSGEDKIFPTICNINNDVEEAIGHNIRIMFIKYITGVNNYYMFDPIGISSTPPVPNAIGAVIDSYMYAGHFDDPTIPSADLNFGATKQLYYNLEEGQLSNNVFNVFYSSYLAEITDKDSRLVTAEIKLNEIDIFNLDFSKFVMVDGVLFRLVKIIDWAEGDVCKVELLRVINTTYQNTKLLRRCTINQNGEADPYNLSPYFSMQKTWYSYAFPYSFTLDALIINGTDYSTGQTLSINDIGDLTVATGVDGRTYYTNVADWINSLIPVGIDLIIRDDFNTVDYTPGLTFDIQITDENVDPIGAMLQKYRYTNAGFFAGYSDPVEWVYINDSNYKYCSYVNV